MYSFLAKKKDVYIQEEGERESQKLLLTANGTIMMKRKAACLFVLQPEHAKNYVQ